MLHRDALLGVHGGVQDANIEKKNTKKRTLAPSITSIVSKFQLDISILSIVYTQNKILEPSGKKCRKDTPPPLNEKPHLFVRAQQKHICS